MTSIELLIVITIILSHRRCSNLTESLVIVKAMTRKISRASFQYEKVGILIENYGIQNE